MSLSRRKRPRDRAPPERRKTLSSTRSPRPETEAAEESGKAPPLAETENQDPRPEPPPAEEQPDEPEPGSVEDDDNLFVD